MCSGGTALAGSQPGWPGDLAKVGSLCDTPPPQAAANSSFARSFGTRPSPSPPLPPPAAETDDDASLSPLGSTCARSTPAPDSFSVPNADSDEAIRQIDAELVRRMRALDAMPVDAGADDGSFAAAVDVSNGSLAAPQVRDVPRRGVGTVPSRQSVLARLALPAETMRLYDLLRTRAPCLSSEEVLLVAQRRKTLKGCLEITDAYTAVADQYGLGYLTWEDVRGPQLSGCLHWSPEALAKDGSLAVFLDAARAQSCGNGDATQLPRLLLSVLACLALLKPVEAGTAGVTLLCDASDADAALLRSLTRLFETVAGCVPMKVSFVFFGASFSLRSAYRVAETLGSSGAKARKSGVQFMSLRRVLRKLNDESTPLQYGGLLSCSAMQYEQFMHSYFQHQWRPRG